MMGPNLHCLSQSDYHFHCTSMDCAIGPTWDILVTTSVDIFTCVCLFFFFLYFTFTEHIIFGPLLDRRNMNFIFRVLFFPSIEVRRLRVQYFTCHTWPVIRLILFFLLRIYKIIWIFWLYYHHIIGNFQNL